MTSISARRLSTPAPQEGAQAGRRRGFCPGLTEPMRTGDGLLVRLRPAGALPLGVCKELCAAARRFGNGIIEITARGSIQVRGLTAASAPHFAAAVAALDIAAADGVPVLTGPLAGIAGAEIVDVRDIVADLRRELARRTLAARVSPKVSVAIDGGGALNLDAVSADIRLRGLGNNGDAVLQVAVAGDAAHAAVVGCIAVRDGADAAIRLLEVLAQRGRSVRARDILAAEGVAPFRSALAHLPLVEAASSAAGCSAADVMSDVMSDVMGNITGDVIGAHRLRDGSLAYGVGLAFGHADASLLEGLIDIAGKAQAGGLIAAPGRALIAVGVPADGADGFAADAERLSFITRSDDPRRHVIACAGAPFCASAHIAARTTAPAIAAALAPLDHVLTIHVSGCAKACAHPGTAALTIVGTPAGCALIANGVARDTPFAVVSEDEMTAAIARYARGLIGDGRHV